jgi:hypothetical protein
METTPGWCSAGGKLVQDEGVWDTAEYIRCPQCNRRLKARTDLWCPISEPRFRVPAHKPKTKKAKTPGRKERRGRRV